MTKIIPFEERAEQLRQKSIPEQPAPQQPDPFPVPDRDVQLRMIFRIIKQFSAFELRELIKVLIANLKDMDDDPNDIMSIDG